MNSALLKHHIVKVDLDTHAITDQIDYLTADEEDSYVVAQANSKLDEMVVSWMMKLYVVSVVTIQ